jgi:hypothetical protein
VEIGSGDEERLLPTDLLNDPEDECINENQNHPQKPVLRKTWSWTPLKGIFLAFLLLVSKSQYFFSNLNCNCSDLLGMRNLQEQFKKAFCLQKLF